MKNNNNELPFAMTSHMWFEYEEGKTALMPGVYLILTQCENEKYKYGIDVMSIDPDGDREMLYDSFEPNFKIIGYTNITPNKNAISSISFAYEEFIDFKENQQNEE